MTSPEVILAPALGSRHRSRCRTNRSGSRSPGAAPLGFDAGDANLYRYVRNAPTDATDPSGLKVEVDGTPMAKNDAVYNKILATPEFANRQRLVTEILDTRIDSTKPKPYQFSYYALELDIKFRLAIIEATEELDLRKPQFETGAPLATFVKGFTPDYWTAGLKFISVKEGESVSAALNELFNNSTKLSCECATIPVIVGHKALLDVLTTLKLDYDKLYEGQKGFLCVVGGFKGNAHKDFFGKDNPLLPKILDSDRIPGDARTFSNPSAKKDDAYRYENAIYLGKDEKGVGKYYAHPWGIKTADEIKANLKAILVNQGIKNPAEPFEETYSNVLNWREAIRILRAKK